tara:strand:- start:261 stop:533 length:273 start_codon:yes stop_codon:yes gene_type:complete
MKTKKLEKVDVDKLKEIRDQYSQNTMQLGMVSTDEHAIKLQLEQVIETKQQLFAKFNELRLNEQELIKELEKKYGEGQINLDEEVFIPNV